MLKQYCKADHGSNFQNNYITLFLNVTSYSNLQVDLDLISIPLVL